MRNTVVIFFTLHSAAFPRLLVLNRHRCAQRWRTSMRRHGAAETRNSKMESTKLLLSAREAAQTLGVSTRTLWALSAPRGRIPVIKIGGRVLYAIADLHDFIAAQRQEVRR